MLSSTYVANVAMPMKIYKLGASLQVNAEDVKFNPCPGSASGPLSGNFIPGRFPPRGDKSPLGSEARNTNSTGFFVTLVP
jgi:hypothetical protein